MTSEQVKLVSEAMGVVFHVSNFFELCSLSVDIIKYFDLGIRFDKEKGKWNCWGYRRLSKFGVEDECCSLCPDIYEDTFEEAVMKCAHDIVRKNDKTN